MNLYVSLSGTESAANRSVRGGAPFSKTRVGQPIAKYTLGRKTTSTRHFISANARG